MNYYSQNGEDFVLWSLFQDKTDGFFVDVGALDGRRFSNTLSFEEAGWTGLCIEAHPFYAKLARKNRPNSVVVHGAASNEDKKEVIFYANELGSLSTLDRSSEDYFKKAYKKAFRGFKELKVPMVTLDSLLQDLGIDEVDLVSIDVEGTELDVLRGFTLKRYKPRIIVLECMFSERRPRIERYMKSAGYLLARKLSNNLFFCYKSDVGTVKSAKIDQSKLVRTVHPLSVRKN